MYISPDKNHHSMLPVEVDGERMLILVGAGGNLAGLRTSKESHQQQLANYDKKHFGITSITHRWADRDYLAYDKIPLIGQLYPWSKHLYVATAFKKWGLSSGTLAAMILNDLITKKDNEWAPIFNPIRLSPIKSIPRAVIEQAKQQF